MWGNATPEAIAQRFARLVEELGSDPAAARVEKGRRELLRAIDSLAPATLGDVAKRVGRGAPAISRAVDTLVRSGLVGRQADPDNRRRLALTLTDEGKAALAAPAKSDGSLAARLGRLAQSELRALERGIEILERLPR